MMESSPSVLNPAILEIDNTEETIPDAEEPNYGLGNESENEDNEQQESGIIDEEGEPVKTLSSNEEGRPSLIPCTKTSPKENLPSSRKQSQRGSHLPQSCQRQSVGRQSLPTTMPHQLQPSSEAGSKGSVVWLNQRTGKEMKSKVNQTSFIWERKPLAEILHPSSKTPKISKGTEKAEADARRSKDPEKAEGDDRETKEPEEAEGDDRETKEPEEAEGDDRETKEPEEAEGDDRETVTPVQDTETEQNAMSESDHSLQPSEETDNQGGGPSPVQPEEQESQHGSEHTNVSQHTQEETLPPAQPPKDATMEGDIKLISKRTGKELKSSFNQTSVIWERKPLAEILGPKTLSPDKRTASPEVGENKQLEALKSTQDGRQEAPDKTLEVPDETLEVSSIEALLASEEESGALEEAPEAPPGEAPES